MLPQLQDQAQHCLALHLPAQLGRSAHKHLPLQARDLP
jgi:hypothetical protein